MAAAPSQTDHLILRDIPNRATPHLSVAFFFPYMSPVPDRQAALARWVGLRAAGGARVSSCPWLEQVLPRQANVVKRYFDGDHLSVQPVGPSPALMSVDNLRKASL